jgi:hypothetical protein
MDNRIDTWLAVIVAKGIAIDYQRGSAMAWAFMSVRNVPTAVILRVLTDPTTRRPTDTVPTTSKIPTTSRNVIRLAKD